MCDELVKMLPMWLAPNLVTLLSFAFNVLPHLLIICLYGNDMEGPIDSWVAVMLGLAYFFYTTLDNMDGKQARRIGAGSPMGMLFDHGLDATTAVVVMYPLGRIHNIGGGLPLLLFIMMSTVPFYYITLEEYYMGKMVLPAFSGPDDTSLVISALCFYTAYQGSEFWLKEYDLGFGSHRVVHLAISAIFISELAHVFLSVSQNLYAGRKSETFKKRYTPASFLVHLSYMAVLVSVYIGYTQLTGSTVLIDYPKLTTMCYGGQYL